MTWRTASVLLGCLICAACTSMLPRSKEATASPWQSYEDAQSTFDAIVPGMTTVQELKYLSLDPVTNPNIAILNYSDVLRRFLMNQSVSLSDLDEGVRECVTAKVLCKGYEIDQRSIRKHRNGSFWLDFLGFKKETQIAGWRFQGLILLKNGVVVYKLSGGQPAIMQQEETQNPLGPIQAVGDKIFSTLVPN